MADLGLKFGSAKLQNTSPNHCVVLPWSPHGPGALGTQGLALLALCCVLHIRQGTSLRVGAPGCGRPRALSMVLASNKLGQQSQLCPAVAVWWWASHCTSLGLKFPICKWAQESPHCPVMREEVKDLIYVKSSEVTPSASSLHRALHTIGTRNVMSCYCYRYYFKTAFSTFPVPRTN